MVKTGNKPVSRIYHQPCTFSQSQVPRSRKEMVNRPTSGENRVLSLGTGRSQLQLKSPDVNIITTTQTVSTTQIAASLG